MATDPLDGWRVHDLDAHTARLDHDCYVDVKRAWELPGVEREIPVTELLPSLREEAWRGMSPLECGHRDPDWSLMLEADLSYPIIVTPRLEVVDGLHRLLKVWLLGHQTIPARIVTIKQLLTCQVDVSGLAEKSHCEGGIMSQVCTHCAWCRSVLVDGEWYPLGDLIDRSAIQVSDGACDDCADEMLSRSGPLLPEKAYHVELMVDGGWMRATPMSMNITRATALRTALEQSRARPLVRVVESEAIR